VKESMEPRAGFEPATYGFLNAGVQGSTGNAVPSIALPG